MSTLRLVPNGPFSLRESALFGFGQRSEQHFDGVMRLAFCLDRTYEPVGVAVRQADSGVVELDVHTGPDPGPVTSQVARMLSLDRDAHGFAALGDRDGVLARMLAAAPGLRPPLFHSAYEAAAWAVLSARRPARQMQQVRQALAERHGTHLTLAGQSIAVFPAPEQLLRVEQVPGLDEEKVRRLHGVARAALEGDLDTDGLRALDPAEATSRLQALRGIGPFSASLIVLRALGHTDLLPDEEPRLLALMGPLYGLGESATQAQLEQVAQAWRPFRTWACVLVRAASSRLAAAA